MRKTALFMFIIFFGVSFSTLAMAQQKEKKVDSKTTKVDTKNTDPQYNEVVSVKKGTPVNSICPVSGEDLEDDMQLIKYHGEIIGVCCKKCLAKIKADPDKYLKRLKIDNKSDKKKGS
jgi:NAD-dependent SIR2 family protein deacetylase